MRESRPYNGDHVSATARPADRDPWLGLGLILLSGVGAVTCAGLALLLDWRIGLGAFGGIVMVLSLFLGWEMRRRRVSRRAEAARREARAAVTGPNSL